MSTFIPSVEFRFDTKKLEREMALATRADLTAVIRNEAQTEDGFFYWPAVNDGRGPVRPVRAKVLRFVTKDGKVVFTKFARASAPRHMRENSLPVIRQRANLELVGGPTSFTRNGIASHINRIARIALEEMARRTPVITGKLKNSYRVEKAR